jgi:hypothetical protein
MYVPVSSPSELRTRQLMKRGVAVQRSTVASVSQLLPPPQGSLENCQVAQTNGFLFSRLPSSDGGGGGGRKYFNTRKPAVRQVFVGRKPLMVMAMAKEENKGWLTR